MTLPTDTTPVAKSLHTVKVIQQVTRYVYATTEKDREQALEAALIILGLYGRPDPYGLAAKALKGL